LSLKQYHLSSVAEVFTLAVPMVFGSAPNLATFVLVTVLQFKFTDYTWPLGLRVKFRL